MPDFNELLSMSADEAVKPPPMPAGSYIFIVKDYETVESSQKKTPGIQFTATPVEPLDDVDTELLPENYRDRKMNVTHWITENAMWRLREFLEHCGLEVEGRAFTDLIPEAVNQQFVGHVVQEPSTKNPKEVVSYIDSTAAVE